MGILSVYLQFSFVIKMVGQFHVSLKLSLKNVFLTYLLPFT